MKKLLVGLLALGSISSFAQALHKTVKFPKYNNYYYISSNSSLDGVCKHLGLGKSVEAEKSQKGKTILLEGFRQTLRDGYYGGTGDGSMRFLARYKADKRSGTVKVDKNGEEVKINDSDKRYIRKIKCRNH